MFTSKRTSGLVELQSDMGVKAKTEVIVENINRKLEDNTGKTQHHIYCNSSFEMYLFISSSRQLAKPRDMKKCELPLCDCVAFVGVHQD